MESHTSGASAASQAPTPSAPVSGGHANQDLVPHDPLASGLQPASCPMSTAMWGWLLALICLSITLGAYNLRGGAGFEPVDGWVAQTAREMTERNEWLIPYFAGEVRLQKSPGPYWAVMLTSRIAGEPVNEFTARLPNVFFGVLTVITSFWLTRRLAGDRAAIFAGAATACSIYVLAWSHRAASDLGVTALCAFSLACFWIAYGDSPPGRTRNRLVLLGYFVAGLGMLYKMPMPFVLVGLPMFLYILLRNRWGVLFHWTTLVGIAIFCLPWLPWLLAVANEIDGAWDKWRVEYWDRLTGDLPNVEGQRESAAEYLRFIIVPAVFCLPWSLSIPSALWGAIRPHANIRRDGQWFLLFWLFGLTAFFIAAAGKENRYLLPLLPPLLCLLGIELSRIFDPQTRNSPAMERLMLILAPIAVAGTFGGLVYVLQRYWMPQLGLYYGYDWDRIWPVVAILGALFTSGALLAVGLYATRRRNAAFAALAGTMVASWLWAWPNVVPYFVNPEPFRGMSRAIATQLNDDERGALRHVSSQDSRLIWYHNVKIPRLIEQIALLNEQGGERDLEWERLRYGMEMVNQLGRDELVLMAIPAGDYVAFEVLMPYVLGEFDRVPPERYLWLAPSLGPPNRHIVVIGNRPPRWESPALNELLAQAIESRRAKLVTEPESVLADLPENWRSMAKFFIERYEDRGSLDAAPSDAE